MELADDLRFTLDRTLEIALGLEEVNNLLHPKSIGSNAKKRILSISKEMRALSHHMKYRDSSVPRDTKISSQSHESPKRKTEVISDSPTIKVKRNLQFSLNETNQRLKLSRAGKRTIGSMITNEALDPPILKQILKDSGKNRFMKTLKNSEVKPLPYVSLTTGKIENPIELPSYEEYLESQGADFIIKRGKDELLYRIEKATNQLSKLKSELSLRNFTRAKNEDRKRRGAVVRVAKLHGTQRTSLSVDMRHESDVIMNKTQDLRALMHKYYAATPNSSTVNTPRLHNHSSLDAESSLEESLRSFYTSKAVENQKLI